MKQLAHLSVSVALLFGVAGFANAAEHNRDHLKCYRAAEQPVQRSVVDLDTSLFGIDAGCAVTSAVRELCVPAAADVLAGGTEDDAISGENLESERLCYRIKCPRRSRPALQVSDRFGTRTVSVGRPKIFCTAARPVDESVAQ